MPENSFLLDDLRAQFHQSLLSSILVLDAKGIPTNADKDQKSSVFIARHIADKLGISSGSERMAGQTTGNKFEETVSLFLSSALNQLSKFIYGVHNVQWVNSRKEDFISHFQQYRHLVGLNKFARENRDLAASLGNSYTISPDIIIARHPASDEEMNQSVPLVSSHSALHSSFRSANGVFPFLHAVISCKWTLRSDRAQNARSEALTLIRNRKGRLPHIVVVTGEPTPSRLSSLALGTGDIDCLYHIALYELEDAIKALGQDEAYHLYRIMVEGGRLKDISDLPLDLLF